MATIVRGAPLAQAEVVIGPRPPRQFAQDALLRVLGPTSIEGCLEALGIGELWGHQLGRGLERTVLLDGVGVGLVPDRPEVGLVEVVAHRVRPAVELLLGHADGGDDLALAVEGAGDAVVADVEDAVVLKIHRLQLVDGVVEGLLGGLVFAFAIYVEMGGGWETNNGFGGVGSGRIAWGGRSVDDADRGQSQREDRGETHCVGVGR